MKKLFAAVLAALLLLTACGKDVKSGKEYASGYETAYRSRTAKTPLSQQ